MQQTTLMLRETEIKKDRDKETESKSKLCTKAFRPSPDTPSLIPQPLSELTA